MQEPSRSHTRTEIASPSVVRSAARRCARAVAGEARLTVRMIADNALLCVLPPVLFSLAAAAHAGLGGSMVVSGAVQTVVLSLLFVYIFDSANQFRGVQEDLLNKPYRPVPAGLTDERGLLLRFAIVMPVYTLAAWAFGALPWVLLWQASVLAQLSWGSGRYYLWWKTPATISGSIVQLGTGWSVVAPLDSVAWSWIVVISIFLPLACVFEDVRDVEGDRAAGRTTWPMVVGDAPVRGWFVVLMGILPVVILALATGSADAPAWRIVVLTAVVAVAAWFCAVRAVVRRNTADDRVTYQLFTATWAVCLAAAPLALW